MNPFFHEYNTPFGTIPFSKISLEHYLPGVKKGIEEAKQEIKAITSNEDAPSFANTIVALESSGKLLSKVTSAFFNLNSAETSDEMQQLAQEISPLLSAHSNEVATNPDLFRRIQNVYENKPSDLTAEEEMLLEKTYKNFVRNGANLSDEDKETLKKIDQEASILSLKFGENALKESNAFEMHLTDEADLEGLPESIRNSASQLAKAKGKDGGWLFTLDYPSYVPFMTYSAKRDLRKKMSLAFGSKAFKDNENNNEDIIKKLVELRAKRAQLLGYKSHADYVLELRMAESPENVTSFIQNIQKQALPFAQKEYKELEAYAKSVDNIAQLEKWDGAYYSEKMKKERFAIDDEVLRPYFKLENVVNGVFETATKLFGITFHRLQKIDVYHEDVETYEVKDESGKHLAVFYADFFPRAGKRQGAWMTSFRGQKKTDDGEQRPHVSIVCNFTKPTENKPSLLTFNEVTTLFHEFGHALHGILADGTYESLSGTSVYWDFVELPSQLMENWCYEAECLNLFAQHYETGETIPQEYVTKIKEAATFMEGMATVRQLSLGKLDMAYHTTSNPDELLKSSIKAIESEAIKGLDLYPKVEETCTSTSFSHIFQGGYSSGYYSYKWAEVLDADAFDLFKEKGIFDKQSASSFRKNVLSAGGSEHPSILYKRFRGRNPKPDALLKRAGLID